MPNATRIEACYDAARVPRPARLLPVRDGRPRRRRAAEHDLGGGRRHDHERRGAGRSCATRPRSRRARLARTGGSWAQIAERLGAGDELAFASIEGIFEELRGAIEGRHRRLQRHHVRASRARPAACSGRCRSEDHPGTPRLFEERFNFPDGRARFHAVEWREPAEPVDDEFPLRLTTGRTVAHFLSGNQTRRIGGARRADAPAVGRGAPLARLRHRRPGPRRHSARGDHVARARDRHDPRRHGLRALPLGGADGGEPDDGRRPASRELKIPEYKVCACRVERGRAIDALARAAERAGLGDG